MADHLAQVLHCLMKSVACPMEDRVEADSEGAGTSSVRRRGYDARSSDAENQMRSGINV